MTKRDEWGFCYTCGVPSIHSAQSCEVYQAEASRLSIEETWTLSIGAFFLALFLYPTLVAFWSMMIGWIPILATSP